MSTAITPPSSAINLSLSPPPPPNMTPQASTSKNLNPFAPEYKPISAGVTPNPHAPPPFFLPTPPPTASRPSPSSPHLQPPPLLPHQIRNYAPSTSLHTPKHSFHPTYSTYVTFRNQVYTAPPRQRPPPPTAASSAHCGQLEKGSGRRGRGHGRRRESTSWSERAAGKISNFNYCERRVDVRERNYVGSSKHQQLSKPFLKNGENKHRILPLNPDEEKTTVMIKNIPYECPRCELISILDDFCLLENQKAAEGTSTEEAAYAYDFVYLPIDFRTNKSRGFAFVNFTTPRAVWKFFNSFHNKQWDFVKRYMKWPKKIEIVRAQIQGKEALVKHFSGSVFQCGTDEFLPVSFTPARDGSEQAVEMTVFGNRRAPPRRDTRHNHEA